MCLNQLFFSFVIKYRLSCGWIGGSMVGRRGRARVSATEECKKLGESR